MLAFLSELFYPTDERELSECSSELGSCSREQVGIDAHLVRARVIGGDGQTVIFEFVDVHHESGDGFPGRRQDIKSGQIVLDDLFHEGLGSPF